MDGLFFLAAVGVQVLLTVLAFLIALRIASTLGRIEVNTAEALKEMRYIRHLDELKAGVAPDDPPQ